MILECFAFGPYATNTYVLGDSSGEAVIIDAPLGGAEWIEKMLKKHRLVPVKLLLTHSHLDHIAEASLLKNKWNIPVWIHPQDQGNLKNPGSDGIPLFFPIDPVQPDGFLNDQEEVRCGNLTMKVLWTPGHSPGSVCFYLEKQSVLISGDTLFQGAMGRVDLPGSSPKEMHDSLKKLSLLPKETKVFPGHGEETTIGQEPWIAR